MDPNANLAEQERILAEIPRVPTSSTLLLRDKRARLKELRVALVDWLKAGGFEPAWSKCPKATRYFAGRWGGSIGPEFYRKRSS